MNEAFKPEKKIIVNIATTTQRRTKYVAYFPTYTSCKVPGLVCFGFYNASYGFLEFSKWRQWQLTKSTLSPVAPVRATTQGVLNVLRSSQTGRHVTSMFQMHFIVWKLRCLDSKSTECVSNGAITNKEALDQIMTWHRTRHKTLYRQIEWWHSLTIYIGFNDWNLYMLKLFRKLCVWISYTLSANWGESPCQCDRFASQLVEVYVNFDKSSILCKRLYRLYQSASVLGSADFLNCPPKHLCWSHSAVSCRCMQITISNQISNEGNNYPLAYDYLK